MKKLICLFLQVISLTMWFIFIVDKEKINLIFNISKNQGENIQVLFITVATAMLILAMIGFMTPDKTTKSLYRKNTVEN